MRTILRRNQIDIPVTTAWELQQAGLYPHFFKISGQKAAGIFADEHDSVMALRAAGCTDNEVRQLVDKIHTARQEAAHALIGGKRHENIS